MAQPTQPLLPASSYCPDPWEREELRSELPDLAKTKTGYPVPFGFQIKNKYIFVYVIYKQYLGHAFTKKLFIMYM